MLAFYKMLLQLLLQLAAATLQASFFGTVRVLELCRSLKNSNESTNPFTCVIAILRIHAYSTTSTVEIFIKWTGTQLLTSFTRSTAWPFREELGPNILVCCRGEGWRVGPWLSATPAKPSMSWMVKGEVWSPATPCLICITSHKSQIM